MQAHRDYWIDVLEAEDENNNSDRIPDLEVYVVTLHPSKQLEVPLDHDGVKDRHNDITYCDRNSNYDEKVANLVTDYIDLIGKLKSMIRMGHHIKYGDLLKGRFELTRVVRIERANDVDSISGKVGDFTQKTIKQLIRQGENDAMRTLKYI